MSMKHKEDTDISSPKEIDLSDIPEMNDEQLAELKPSLLRNPENYRPVKKKICMYIDADVLEWYKGDGERGYQTRMNQVLRQNMVLRSSPKYGKAKNTPGEEKE